MPRMSSCILSVIKVGMADSQSVALSIVILFGASPVVVIRKNNSSFFQRDVIHIADGSIQVTLHQVPGSASRVSSLYILIASAAL
jgi:hypothetical protein